MPSSVIARFLSPKTYAGRILIALVIMAGVTGYILSPVFKGYTLSEAGTRMNTLYPWAYQATGSTKAISTDQTDMFYPWQVFISDALKAGEFPLWDPYSFAGRPFFSNGQNGLLYPPRVLLSLVATPARVHDLLLLSHMMLGGLTMFLMLADAKVSVWASLFGGISWMLNPYMLWWMPIEIFLPIEVLLPLSFLLMRTTVRRGSWARGVWLGIVMAPMFFGAQVLLVEFSILAIGCYGAYLLVREWRRAGRSSSGFRLGRAVKYGIVLSIPAAVLTGLIAIQLIPTFETVQSMYRAELSYAGALGTRVPVSDLRFLIVPYGGGVAKDPYMLIATPTALLALIGIWRRHSLVLYLRGMAIVVLLLVIGAPVVWIFFKLMPGFSHMPLDRLPFLVYFAAAALAAFGMDFIIQRVPRLIAIKSIRPWRLCWRAAVTATLSCIVVAQMRPLAAWMNPHDVDRGALQFPVTPLIAALGDPESVRILPIDPEFVGETPTMFKLQSGGGYDSIVPERTAKLWRTINESDPKTVFDRPSPEAIETEFTIDSAFDLLPRVGITDLVVPPVAPTLGGKWNIPDRKAIDAAGLANGDLVPFVGDWDGDGVETTGFCEVRSNTFYLWNAASDSSPITFQFGALGRGWIPIAGDWNGDKIDTVGMYDPANSVFHLRNSNSSGPDDLTLKYGEPGGEWSPLAGDWDGDGVDSLGLYNSKRGVFRLKRTLKTDANDEVAFQFGHANRGLVAVVGDWDGDGVDSIGVYDARDGVFQLRNRNEAGTPNITVQYGLTNRNLIPLSGYWAKGVSRGRFDVVALFDRAAMEFYLSVPACFGQVKTDHVYAGPDGDIYKVENPVPRAYIVPAAEVVDSPRAALLRFTDLSFDPAKAVIVESGELKKAGVYGRVKSGGAITGNIATAGNEVSNSAGSAVAAAGGAEILSRTLNSMTVRADSARDGWLVIAESWDAGWTAKVDGTPAPVLPGNYAFRTMFVPAGLHMIELVYRPVGFLLGSVITGATVAVLLIVAAISRFNRRTRRA